MKDIYQSEEEKQKRKEEFYRKLNKILTAVDYGLWGLIGLIALGHIGRYMAYKELAQKYNDKLNISVPNVKGGIK